MKAVFMNDTLKKDIFDILSAMPETRKDDNKLFAELVKLYARRSPEYADKLNAVTEAFANSRKYGLPNYTSMIRERRELQKMFPVLLDEKTADKRSVLETEFREKYGRKRE